MFCLKLELPLLKTVNYIESNISIYQILPKKKKKKAIYQCLRENVKTKQSRKMPGKIVTTVKLVRLFVPYPNAAIQAFNELI